MGETMPTRKENPMVLEHSLGPHGAHRLILLDDSSAAGNRIYRIESNTTATVIEGQRVVDAIHMTGVEIEGLWNAYQKELARRGMRLRLGGGV
jgi:hypothetical protein